MPGSLRVLPSKERWSKTARNMEHYIQDSQKQERRKSNEKHVHIVFIKIARFI